ncbi:MAG: tRNA lysidine(34) synthetase TilS [Motiliproteus sp.]
MTLTSSLITELLADLAEIDAGGPVWVAYSGGMDSHLLLQLAVDAGLNQQGRLRAVHIDHGLNPAAADWAVHCRSVCDDLKIELQCFQIELEGGAGLENRARQARYRIFESLLAAGGVLLQGHHADDQAETLLLRLMRASGVRGLAAIPRSRQLGRGRLLRPLLRRSRAELQHQAQQQGLRWINDPSNADTVHDRNFLRAEVVPALVRRWPQAVPTLGRSADNCADALRLTEDLAALDIEGCWQEADRYHDRELKIDALAALPDYRRFNLLRFWLQRRAGLLPDDAVLTRLWQQLVSARDDAQPLIEMDGWLLRRFDGALYLLNPAWNTLSEAASPIKWYVDVHSASDMIFAGGRLDAKPAVGAGLLLPAGACVRVMLRQGGERICLPGRVGSRSLKKLLQQQRLAPWIRRRLPLLFVDDELVAVAGFWIAEGWQAAPDQQGIVFDWQPLSPLVDDGCEGDF